MKTERQKAPAQPHPQAAAPTAPTILIGIGASAGGLDACRTLLSKLPSDAGFCVLLVVHLLPDHESVMAELLAKDSAMPVETATHGQVVRANSVYVVPPNFSLSLVKGAIVLEPLRKADRLTRIDGFLRSVAADQGECAVGVILTGMGSDGTLGLRAIKEAGGLTVVQTPETAEHGEMPRSALADGCVDSALDLEAMPDFFLEHRDHVLALRPPEEEEDAESSLSAICHLLGRQLRHDFSQYKKSTLQRRVRRRMMVLGVDSLKNYVAWLDADEQEARRLLRELLISVTRFFRDPDCFEALEPVISQLVEQSAETGLRIWVPACASGEEAYSLAILVAEAFTRLGRPILAQIFATEIDQSALQRARKGRYAEGIRNDVSAQRLQRFFTFRAGGYEVKKELRAMCLFSQHNVISDPPFSRIDLVSCRNLFIYFDAQLQRRVLTTFHYALRAGGHLLLGTAESMSDQRLFRTVDMSHQIYRAQQVARPKASSLIRREPYSNAGGQARSQDGVSGPEAKSAFARFVLPQIQATVVTIDRDDRVVDMCGQPERYLAVQSAQIEDNIFTLIRKELASKLRRAVQAARQEKKVAVQQGVAPALAGPGCRLDLRVYPYLPQKDGDTDFWVVLFQQIEVDSSHVEESPSAADATVAQLETELTRVRQHLRAVTSELESHIADLHSNNEEMTALNEEFQSANEELETSREEIQSTNQELMALTCELQESAHDRVQAHSDLFNLFSSNPNPTIFLDRELNIRQFTASSVEVFRLLSNDLGRPITDIACRLSPLDFPAKCHDVMSTSEPYATSLFRAASDPLGAASFRLRILPYLGLPDNNLDGVVLSFTDVTEADLANANAEKRARQIAAVARVGVLAPKEDSLDRFAEQTLEEICEVLTMEVASFHRLLPESQELELVKGRGWEGGDRMPLAGNSVVGHAMLAGESISFADLDGAGQSGDSPLLVQQGLCCGITTAVMHEGHPYGVLGAYGKSRREFTPDEVDFMESMAGLLGTALAHRQDSFLRALENVVTSTLATSTDLLEALARELGASVCELWLFENGTDGLTCTAVNQMSDETTAHSGVGLIGKVWQEKEPVWVVDLHTSSLFFPSEEAKRRGLMSGFAVPLLSGGEPIGVLSCFFPVRLSSSRRMVAALKAAGSAIGEFLRRREAERGLQQSEDRLHQALKTVPFPLCIIVETGELLLVSDATYELTGLPYGSLTTLTQWAEGPLRDPYMAQIILDLLKETVERPEVQRRSIHTVWAVNGDKLLWDFSVAPLGRSINGKRMLTAVGFDVTQREISRQALEESSAYKDDFLAMLGHELRNPLAGIRNGVQLLKMANTIAESSEAIGVVDRQSFQMTCLIDGLLDVSRIARGKVSIDPAPLNLCRLAATLVADRRPAFTASGLELTFEPDPVPSWVNGDRVRLLQVLDNLLSNSLKFTERGGSVSITISTVQNDVVMTVRDNGQGMTPELVAVAFEPFRQGPQTLSRSFGGLGLGLSLVKLIVELHDGSVSVFSAGPLRGTEFRLTIPACPPSPDQELSERLAPEPWSILVVEDNEDFARSLTLLLREAGHQVRHCAEAFLALVVLEEYTPEVVLCDLGLPGGMDGYELMERIKELPNLEGVPVIAMSGYGLAEDKARSRKAGFTTHLTKPFDLEDVDRVLRALSRPNPQGARSLAATNGVTYRWTWHPELSRVLVVDDNAMVASSLAKMLNKIGLQAQYACSAAEAMTVARALRPQIAVLDLGLPDRSGFELKADLAQMPECQDCQHYFALTGSDSVEDKNRTRAAGFSAHMVKPVSLDQLANRIEQAGQAL